MALRQIALVAATLAVIVVTAVVILAWDTTDDVAIDPDATETTSTTSTTTSTTTTTIPVDCLNTAQLETSTTTTEAADSDSSAPTTSFVWPNLGPNDSVSTVGIGEITFGMTVRQAEAASGTWLSPCAPVSDCYRVTPSPAPEGLSFVVTEGTIERLDVVAGPVTTRSGIGIGSEEQEIIERFDDQLETVPLDATTKDLVFVPTDAGDADFRVIFTVRDGFVESMRSGRVPQVVAQDPCITS